MFAVISHSGTQHRADLGCSLLLDRIDAEVGAVINIDPKDILMVYNNGFATKGDKPSVQVEVLEHVRGPKLVIFKKRRRKNYERKNGFKSSLTKVLVKTRAI